MLDRSLECEKIRLARARSAAPHVDRGDGGFVEDECGRTGGQVGVLGVADLDSGNIRNEIAQEIGSAMFRTGFSR